METDLSLGLSVGIAGECAQFCRTEKEGPMVTYIKFFFGVLPTGSYRNTYGFARMLLPVQPFSGEVNNTWTAMVIAG